MHAACPLMILVFSRENRLRAHQPLPAQGVALVMTLVPRVKPL
jgi:hypothetical protein